jgi:mRNA-degrading endonuclease RelE of RelBE toxin-antitoxin system
MKRYKVVVSRTAEKELAKLPARVVEKIIALLVSLQHNPPPVSAKS